jgi:hypothetical protein
MNYCNPLWETVFHNDIIWICMVLAAYSSWLTFSYHNLGQSSHFWLSIFEFGINHFNLLCPILQRLDLTLQITVEMYCCQNMSTTLT